MISEHCYFFLAFCNVLFVKKTSRQAFVFVFVPVYGFMYTTKQGCLCFAQHHVVMSP